MPKVDTTPEIVIADDDVELCALLKEYLMAEGYQVDCVHDGQQAVTAAISNQYQVMILDVMLPELDGFQVLEKIRNRSKTPVLMLSARGEPNDRIVGLDLGADDYLAKPCYPQELAARLRVILRRSQPSPLTNQFSYGPISIDTNRQKVDIHGQPLPLTGSEFSLLSLLVQAKGEPVSKNDLTERALNRPLSAYDRSVDVHISNIRRKIKRSHPDLEAIKSQRNLGYRLIFDNA